MSIIDPTLPSERIEQHKAHGAFWYKWLGHLREVPNAHGLELGAWQGESAEWFLDHILVRTDQRLITVDTFEGSEEHKIAGIDCESHLNQTVSRLARFNSRAKIVRSYSDAFLISRYRQTEKDQFDFIYVDAAHDAMNVLRDSVLAFDLLKIGGIMIWDDFLWEVMEQPIDRPKIAIDGFLSCYARRLEVIGYGWQVAVSKIA